LPIPNNEELIPAKWEIEPNSAPKIDRNRFSWIGEVRPREWMPTPVLSRSTILQHLIFESRWNEPVLQPKVDIELQIKWSGSSMFNVVASWNTALDAHDWGELTNIGTSISYAPKGEEEMRELCDPPDLHKYTGTKGAIPKEGFPT
jgi:hypothetical protein